MTILFYIFLGLVAYHFVCEAIVGPTLRHLLRYRFFAVRDSLRRLMIAHPEEREAMLLLNDSINHLMQRMPEFGITYVNRAIHACASNPELRREVDERIEFFERCPIPEFQRIRGRISDLFRMTFMVNSIAYMPIFYGAYLLGIFKKWASATNQKMLAFMARDDVDDIKYA